jgi:hypothetical protein
MCNRDESRLRPVALAPQIRALGSRQACMPVDPVSDGTWIGANDAGLIAVLMNVYVPAGPAEVQDIEPGNNGSRLSRGRVIPQVLQAATIGGARILTDALAYARFEPFRLLIADRRELVEIVWSHGQSQSHLHGPIRNPLFFTSSGLGDAVVAEPRRRLFDELFCDADTWQASQEAFHRHEWPGNERVSVWMTRPEAMTVSRTVVELGAEFVHMRYFARVADKKRETSAESIRLPIDDGQSARYGEKP